MTRIVHFVAAGSLALGAFALTGCEENTLPPNENGTTAGGNGAFGESPAGAGKYDSGNTTPATQPSANERGTTAGGNGEFGESPARPGTYDSGTATPATQPSANPNSPSPDSVQPNPYDD